MCATKFTHQSVSIQLISHSQSLSINMIHFLWLLFSHPFNLTKTTKLFFSHPFQISLARLWNAPWPTPWPTPSLLPLRYRLYPLFYFPPAQPCITLYHHQSAMPALHALSPSQGQRPVRSMALCCLLKNNSPSLCTTNILGCSPNSLGV